MEIEQYLYYLNDSGDAIVAYTMRSASGASVQLCNMGAAVLALTIDGREIASGRCVRGLQGVLAESDRFDERLWESRVEFNRVIMSLRFEMNGAGAVSEVVFDFDDEDSFEITYQAYLEEGDTLFDLTHALAFDLGGEVAKEVRGALSDGKIYSIEGASKGILREVATLRGEVGVEILSSHPSLYLDGDVVATVSSPVEMLKEGERYITKSVIRPIR